MKKCCLKEANFVFRGLFDSESAYVISPGDFLMCIAAALVIGLFLTLCYRFRNRCSKSFAGTLAILPAIVCVVIMLVNGNIGAGVAVAGAFGLVRFRSLPGTAREIGMLFMAMCAGLICGMGYLAYAILFALILGGAGVLYSLVDFGGSKADRFLTITIPEDLDYTEVFTSLMDEYTTKYALEQIRTTNMGSLFRLSYYITLKDASKEKEFIDKLRCRNGNLEIMIAKSGTGVPEL
jgi:hypothetical protein